MCICECVSMCVRVCVCVCVPMCMDVCVFAYVCVCMCTCQEGVRVCVCLRACACASAQEKSRRIKETFLWSTVYLCLFKRRYLGFVRLYLDSVPQPEKEKEAVKKQNSQQF